MGLWNLDTRASEIRETALMARRLGFSGIGIILGQEEAEKGMKAEGIDVARGVLVSGNPDEIRKRARAVRRGTEIVVAAGGEEALNRAILETPEVDVLSGHLINGSCGINHVLARLAARNSVALEFDFCLLLGSWKKQRAGVVSGPGLG